MTTLRQLDTSAPTVFPADSMRAEASPRSFSQAWAKIPAFWKFQIAGWTAHALVTLPLKVIIFNSVSTSLLTTLVAEPIGFIQTCVLRMVYRRLGLRVERPRRL